MSARLARRLADRRGVTALEFGLIAPLFLLVTIAFFEFGLQLAIRASLDFAVREASRAGITGAPPPAGMTRLEQMRAIIARSVLSIVDPARISLTAESYDGFQDIGRPEPFTDLNGNGTRDPGEPYTDVNGNGRWDADQGVSGLGDSGQVTVYRVTYGGSPITGYFPAVTYDSRIIVRNEPYPE